MPSFQTFKDLSVTFKKHPVTDDLVTVKDKAAIVQAMTALRLQRRERLFQPELGTDLAKTLFEPLDYGTATIVKSTIKETLMRYEPRISVDDILCEPDFNNNGYSVELYYTIVGRDDLPQSVEFFLERTR